MYKGCCQKDTDNMKTVLFQYLGEDSMTASLIQFSITRCRSTHSSGSGAAAAVGQSVAVTPAPHSVMPVLVLGNTTTSHPGLQDVNGLAGLGHLAVHLHTLVDPLLECLCDPLPEDEGDHDCNQLQQVNTTKAQRIL